MAVVNNDKELILALMDKGYHVVPADLASTFIGWMAMDNDILEASIGGFYEKYINDHDLIKALTEHEDQLPGRLAPYMDEYDSNEEVQAMLDPIAQRMSALYSESSGHDLTAHDVIEALKDFANMRNSALLLQRVARGEKTYAQVFGRPDADNDHDYKKYALNAVIEEYFCFTPEQVTDILLDFVLLNRDYLYALAEGYKNWVIQQSPLIQLLKSEGVLDDLADLMPEYYQNGNDQEILKILRQIEQKLVINFPDLSKRQIELITVNDENLMKALDTYADAYFVSLAFQYVEAGDYTLKDLYEIFEV